MLLKLTEKGLLLVETIVLTAQVEQMSPLVRLTALLAVAAMVAVSVAMIAYRHEEHQPIAQKTDEHKANCPFCKYGKEF